MANGTSAGKVCERTSIGRSTKSVVPSVPATNRVSRRRLSGLSQLKSWAAAPVFAAFSAVAFAAAPAHATSTCPQPHEVEALQTRVLQTELMVAALSCGTQQRYNAFARKYYNELSSNSRVLRAYFRRGHDRQGDRYLDRFVTGLANAASERSINHGPAYCADAELMFEKVLTQGPARLVDATQTLTPEIARSLPPCSDRLVKR